MTNAGAERPSRDPRALSQRRRRELDYNNAQVTARRRAAEVPKNRGFVDSETWFYHARSALERGGRMVRPGVVWWPAAGRCENPIPKTLKGLVTDLYGRTEARESGTRTRFLDMEVPCRRCRNCLWRKALHWKHRSIAEMEQASRTWLVTLTFRPEVRSRMTMAAQAEIGGEAYDQLSREQRSVLLAKHANKLVTLWMKRVREDTGPGVRYVSVVERHKDGSPHCHLLVHEPVGTTVLHKTLTKNWVWGFSNAKLVEDTEVSARYVAKYLAKDPISRVRASVGYGQTPGQIPS